MLLIEIIEDLRGGPDIVDQLAAHDAWLLELGALDEAVAQGLGHQRTVQDDPARLRMSQVASAPGRDAAAN